MILTFALLIGAAAFCGEILFNCILKQRIFCAASGNSLVKAVLYPCAIASLALWGTDYLFSQEKIEISLAICAGAALIFFAIEFFIIKNRRAAFHICVYLIQALCAVGLSYYLGEKPDIIVKITAFVSCALLPAFVNTALASAKLRLNCRERISFAYVCSSLLAPAGMCVIYISILQEVLVNLRAL